MKFDPLRRLLSTDDGVPIKLLSCPAMLRLQDFSPGDSPGDQLCRRCGRVVIDTSSRTEEELVSLMRRNPETCVKVDPDQPNVRITYGRS